MAERDYQIATYDGERGSLSSLFALADDSPAAIAAYRDQGSLLVACESKRVIGLALVISDAATRSAELKSLAVVHSRQGRGIGTALVEAAMVAARNEGAVSLMVATAAADIDNLRFYQRVGFRMARIERDAFTPVTGYREGLAVDGIPLRDRVVLDRVIEPRHALPPRTERKSGSRRTRQPM